MSFLFFGNVPASVPPILDTTPCMNEMLNYEDCVLEFFSIFLIFLKKLQSARAPQQELFHPNWPTVWPRLLTDGKLLVMNFILIKK